MVNELRELLSDNVASPPHDGLDLGAVLAGGRRRVRRRRLVVLGGTAAAMLVDAVTFVGVGAAGLSLAVRRRSQPSEHEERRRARDGIGFLFADRSVALMVVSFNTCDCSACAARSRLPIASSCASS